jgi:hypothetical protein
MSSSRPAVDEPVSCSSCMAKTYRDPSSSSEPHPTPQLECKPPSGSESSEGRQLISTISCLQSAGLQSMRKGRLALERQLSLSARTNQKGKSSHRVTGQQLGGEHPRLSPLLSPIRTEELSQLCLPHPCRVRCKADRSPPAGHHVRHRRAKLRLRGTNNGTHSTRKVLTPVFRHHHPGRNRILLPLSFSQRRGGAQSPKALIEPRSAINSTPEVDVPTALAATDMRAGDAEKKDMEREDAQTSRPAEAGRHPKFLRHNLWSADADPPVTTAEWSEKAKSSSSTSHS